MRSTFGWGAAGCNPQLWGSSCPNVNHAAPLCRLHNGLRSGTMRNGGRGGCATTLPGPVHTTNSKGSRHGGSRTLDRRSTKCRSFGACADTSPFLTHVYVRFQTSQSTNPKLQSLLKTTKRPTRFGVGRNVGGRRGTARLPRTVRVPCREALESSHADRVCNSCHASISFVWHRIKRSYSCVASSSPARNASYTRSIPQLQ